MKVEIKQLYEGPMHYNYSHRVELEIQRMLAEFIHATPGPMTIGANDSFDFQINFWRFELKIRNNYLVQLHYLKEGAPFGLLKTNAHFYVVISKGFTNKLSSGVSFKLRIYNTRALETYLFSKFEDDFIQTNSKDYFNIPKKFNHVYVGEFELQDDGFETINFHPMRIDLQSELKKLLNDNSWGLNEIK